MANRHLVITNSMVVPSVLVIHRLAQLPSPTRPTATPLPPQSLVCPRCSRGTCPRGRGSQTGSRHSPRLPPIPRPSHLGVVLSPCGITDGRPLQPQGPGRPVFPCQGTRMPRPTGQRNPKRNPPDEARRCEAGQRLEGGSVPGKRQEKPAASVPIAKKAEMLKTPCGWNAKM